jgi:transcriptional regulator GlxA family with amidase domain
MAAVDREQPFSQAQLPSDPTIAVLALPGVIIDELRAFHAVLSTWPRARCFIVGLGAGGVAGPGGSTTIELSIDDVHAADVLAVPGAIGAIAHADDPRLADWLVAVVRRAGWVLTSSTGSLLLARLGLLRGREATTHWLAGEQLVGFGSQRSDDRVCVDGRFVTCSGNVAAVNGALHVVRCELGEAAAALAADRASAPAASPSGKPHRWWSRRAG